MEASDVEREDAANDCVRNTRKRQNGVGGNC